MAIHAFPCADIPEFAAYRYQHDVVREALLVETNGERDAFIDRAARTIGDCVLRPPSRESDAGASVLPKLYRQGYTRETITRALAAAWFDESDTFALPRRRPRSLLYSGWFLWGLPLLLALLGLLELIEVLRAQYPGKVGVALWFAPVLGMLGFAVAAVFHGVLKLAVATLERLGL
ncbi:MULTISPECIES: hypothetical protein [Thiorhodovibrio]|uniref:hypothetical protein n=1 Tax=Thiorhodovibrio TaxID=61593 RepID=UPI0019144B4B|nr:MULTISPECIES: hypothetical protein [Thiorhodovibrio]MBK5969051.1 hypothetical protein [Thiorhodovibrio winogradskyi]WPL15067.1 hypothetical protein Thiosp_04931 [Thiorhodovibrio litoralis]